MFFPLRETAAAVGSFMTVISIQPDSYPMQPFTLTHPTMKMVNTYLSRLHMSRSLRLTLLTLGLLTPTVSTTAQEVMTLSDLFTLADRHSQELKLKRTEIEVATKGIEVARHYFSK